MKSIVVEWHLQSKLDINLAMSMCVSNHMQHTHTMTAGDVVDLYSVRIVCAFMVAAVGVVVSLSIHHIQKGIHITYGTRYRQNRPMCVCVCERGK